MPRSLNESKSARNDRTRQPEENMNHHQPSLGVSQNKVDDGQLAARLAAGDEVTVLRTGVT